MWLTFQLGRPTTEILFEVPPNAMSIDHDNVEVNLRNLAGDLKTSILKVNAPSIKINSNFLSQTQRIQFMSLMGISDTFLSFLTRDDWQTQNELVTIIDSTHVQIANSSATRLSAALVAAGGGSIINIITPFNAVLGEGYGSGGYGLGGYGGAALTFDPGPVTYNDATRVITLTNALGSLTAPMYVSYTYTGWLVKMQKLTVKNQGGWIDRGTYDIALLGA